MSRATCGMSSVGIRRPFDGSTCFLYFDNLLVSRSPGHVMSGNPALRRLEPLLRAARSCATRTS